MGAAAGESATSARVVGRFLAGDPLRALAALGVLVFHVANGFAGGADRTRDFTAAYGELWGRVLQSGRLGVSIFFVLSGYLVSRPFVRAFMLGTPAPPIGAYLRNRALRIIPAFWVVAALTLLWFGVEGARPVDVIAIFGFGQTYDPTATAATPQLAHAWTLDVEFAYYLLLPLAAVALFLIFRHRHGSGRRRVVLGGVLVAAAAASLVANSHFSSDARWFLTLPPWLYAFIPGIALAAFEAAIGGRVAGRSWSRGAPIACLVGVALLIGWGARTGVSPLVQALASACGAGAIVGSALVVHWSGRRCWKVLDNPPLRALGQWSYGIYLVHLPLMYALLPGLATGRSASARLALGLPVVLSATLLGAIASYYLIERPALRLRARATEPPATGHAPALVRETV